MAPVSTDDTGMRVLADRDAFFKGQSGPIEDPDLMVCFVAHAKFPGAWQNGQAGQKDIGFVSGGVDRALEGGLATGVSKLMNSAGIAARNEKPFAIGGEGEAVPGFGERQELTFFLRCDIHEGDTVTVESAMNYHQRSFVRSDQHFERQVADRDVAARRRQAPAIKQQIFSRMKPLSFAHVGAVNILAQGLRFLCPNEQAGQTGSR